ncbi:MAG TPA: alpha/beta hydrolase [Bellilinea sp.]|nr:alpha/beta hydrolase [Bellilinea sp.]
MGPSKLAYIAQGNDEATPLLLLHGGGASSWMWRPMKEYLRGTYFFIAPDLPGQGMSQDVPFVSMEAAADEIYDFIMDHIPDQTAHIVGLSEGAQVLVALLARHPECVRSALVSSALTQPLPGGKLLTPGLVRWSYKASIPPFRNNDAWIRLNMKYSAGIPDQYFEDFKKEFQRLTEDGFVNMMVANQNFRLPQGLEQTDCPVLALAGKKEYSAMQASAQEIAAACPQGQFAWIDLGAKASLAQEHNWALTAPEQFAAVVEAWIAGEPLPAPIFLAV